MISLAAALARHRLRPLGTVSHDLPAPHQSLVLVGPDTGFWPHFQDSPEFRDSAPDPMDRWSRRVLTACAAMLDATAYFPFGGPPYRPFYSWALASGETFSSPVAFLVHADLGLFTSFRGALAFDQPLPKPTGRAHPCLACTQPCTTACPVAALTPDGYDVDACKAYLDTEDGRDCRSKGCRVRRACPVGAALRDPAQSAFHMAAFHPARR